MDRIKLWQEKLDALSLRERGAILLCALFVIYFVWDSLLMQPLRAEEKLKSTQLQTSLAEQQKLSMQIENILANEKSDPNQENKARLKALKTKLNSIEQQVQNSASKLISPQDMAMMLETVLVKVKGLELQKVRGLGSEPVLRVADGGQNQDGQPALTADDPVSNAYKHGLRIEFRGDYLGTLEYIRELENLEWGFFWESLDLEVNDYPDSSVGITVYTLSLDKNWIGV